MPQRTRPCRYTHAGRMEIVYNPKDSRRKQWYLGKTGMKKVETKRKKLI
jgi:hypothetical protein